MQQARMAMYHAFGRRKGHGSRLRPGGVDTTDEGTIGETEESLRRKGVDYVVGRWQHRSNATGRTVGGADGFLKLLFQREDLKLIGVHLTGEHAAELVHIGMMAMLAGVTAEQLAGLRFNLPTLGELYKTAATEAMGALEDVQEACA
jgi:NAD(P) transhydrogenase